MATNMLSALEELGYGVRVVSIGRLGDLQEDIETRHREKQFDEAFYRKWLAEFVFSPPERLPKIRSLIVVAIRQPQHCFTFTWNGRRTQAIVPPTYLHWLRANQRIQDALMEILGPKGHRLAQARLPRKLLAVRSGLAAYGKNNITYIAGLGSFHRLAVFYSDLPCPVDDWQQPKMMERCQRCSACLQACPSGAIGTDRFLLRADRCIVLHNEEPWEVPFPDWLDPSWHDCLVGCLRCQRVCPENRDCLEWIEEGAEFSTEETQLLLQGTLLEQLPRATRKKLEQSDLVDLMDVLPRNLKALLNKTAT
jgi:epoxyqueuosine reductase